MLLKALAKSTKQTKVGVFLFLAQSMADVMIKIASVVLLTF